jgi:hypothetical protein
MRRKKATITFELVDESIMEADKKIVEELFEWFQEDAISIPWVKNVKEIAVKDK